MQKKKTIRLVLPVWQGGVDPNYAFGAELLSFIAPPSKTEQTFEVFKTSTISASELKEENGIIEETVQIEQLKSVEKLLEKESPDRIIIFGGDCSVSQAPFDYLHQKYGEKTGIIWLDAHPDISVLAESNHNHEFILANIMGKGNTSFSRLMKAPFPQERIIYAGLVEDPNRKMELFEEKLNIPILTPEDVRSNPEKIVSWIKEHNIEKICVHFDLDALTPEDFRSLTSAKPYRTPEEYGAAIGELKLEEIVRFLNTVNTEAEIVGLAIAEHMPWDAINLRNALAKLPIFESGEN